VRGVFFGMDAVDFFFSFESKLFARQLSSRLVVCEVLILEMPVLVHVCVRVCLDVGRELNLHLERCLLCYVVLLSVCFVL